MPVACPPLLCTSEMGLAPLSLPPHRSGGQWDPVWGSCGCIELVVEGQSWQQQLLPDASRGQCQVLECALLSQKAVLSGFGF